MEQALCALKQRPDYIGVGPVFPTATKADADPALGPEETGRIINNISVTAVAIGGIHSGNLAQLLEEKITNFCVVGAVNTSPDPAAAIGRLQKIWKGYSF
jgi:thiamine-phosphate pyrophosphorylase